MAPGTIHKKNKSINCNPLFPQKEIIPVLLFPLNSHVIKKFTAVLKPYWMRYVSNSLSICSTLLILQLSDIYTMKTHNEQQEQTNQTQHCQALTGTQLKDTQLTINANKQNQDWQNQLKNQYPFKIGELKFSPFSYFGTSGPPGDSPQAPSSVDAAARLVIL